MKKNIRQQCKGFSYSVAVAVGLALQIGHAQAATTYDLQDYSWQLCPGNYWIYKDATGMGDDWLRQVTSVSKEITCYTGGTSPRSYKRTAADLYGSYGFWSGGDISGFTPNGRAEDGWDDYLPLGNVWGMYGDDEYNSNGSKETVRVDPPLTCGPLSAGQSVSRAVSVYFNGKYQTQGRIVVKLLDLSTVIVPNGTYTNCLHITLSFFGNVNEEWWARGIGPIKIIHNGETKELAYAVAQDGSRPTLAITNLVNLQKWGYSTVPIQGWAKDNVQVTNVRYRLGTGDWLDATGTTAWSGTISGLVPGTTNLLSAYAQDSNGNCSLTNVVRIVYNQFLPVAGTYNGLFTPDNLAAMGAHENSGSIKLTVTSKGAYSGSFVLAGKTYSLGAGKLNALGHLSKTVGSGTNVIAVSLDLNLEPGTDSLGGTVSNLAWIAVATADRAVFGSTNKPSCAGRYTLFFPGGESETDATTPFGLGCGTVTVDNLGKVALKGSLADGTAISQSSTVSKDGWWPLYVSLYGTKGSVLGWLQFTNDSDSGLLGGEVRWTKRPQATKANFYQMGFTNILETQGALYVAPSNSTVRAIALTNGLVSFIGGNLSAPFTNLVVLGANSVFTNQSANALKLSLDKTKGTFSGKVVVPGTSTPRSFKGAVLQNQAQGWGYFLGTNQSGRVQLFGY
jgi:hypothetical protein